MYIYEKWPMVWLFKYRLNMIPVRVFHQNITNKCDDDTNEEMFMINRCVPSAYIFSVSSMDHTVYCQYRIGLSRIQNDKIKHSSWTSIITAAKYLEHLPDNVQEDSIQNWCTMDWLKTLAICYQIWQSMHTVWTVIMGDTQMEYICKIIQAPKTWPHFLLLSTFKSFMEPTYVRYWEEKNGILDVLFYTYILLADAQFVIYFLCSPWPFKLYILN